ncbi:MAG: tetratricopeptide repeat protein [Thiocapsa sp.]|jgi:tetratricopeptide (TPR) repeat protein|nr:tetratricopeptide repeat protein [Thiocapsa sp.]MCG6895998.1 tetratricopeptide repeat protein [Thiocapsa sp.]MCG6983602.1 tetratricopeptide repeat protein [Thiocapsa sp.]
MKASRDCAPLLFVLLVLTGSGLSADPLSALPEPWDTRLLPVAETDISGAERLMQLAIGEGRTMLAGLLESSDVTDDELAEAYGRLGALFLLVEVEAAADVCLRNAEILQPNVFRWPYYAGYLAMLSGRSDAAVNHLERARALDPEYAPLNLRLGKVLLDTGRLGEAEALLKRIADAPGLVAAANFYLGQIANLQRRYADAVIVLERSLEADPAPSGVRYQLAVAYRAMGDQERARAYLADFDAGSPAAHDPLIEELEAVTRRSLPAFQEAMHAARQGDYEAAASRFADGLSVDPDNRAARVSYARTLYLAGSRGEAERELARVLSEDPGEALASFLMGVLKQAQGDKEGAASAYRRTLEAEPGHPGAAFYLANLELARGRFREAAAGYRAVLTSDDAVGPAYLLELIASRRSGTSERDIVERLAERASERPDDTVLAYALARLLAAAKDPVLRDPERALELAGDLARRQPIPPHQRALALALMADGRTEEAIATLQPVIAYAAWSVPPGELALLLDESEAYREGRLPDDPWPDGDGLLAPPPFDPLAAFRDYPSATPY